MLRKPIFEKHLEESTAHVISGTVAGNYKTFLIDEADTSNFNDRESHLPIDSTGFLKHPSLLQLVVTQGHRCVFLSPWLLKSNRTSAILVFDQQ